MASAPLPLSPAPIKFGTDGWRGITGVDITVERLLPGNGTQLAPEVTQSITKAIERSFRPYGAFSPLLTSGTD